tara:strand:- start:3155 stop:3352 length:198 start_codon:yes stop_codon:yes gene_type:complete
MLSSTIRAPISVDFPPDVGALVVALLTGDKAQHELRTGMAGVFIGDPFACGNRLVGPDGPKQGKR